MIRFLLSHSLPRELGLASAPIRVPMRMETEIFVLSDAKACDECSKKCQGREACNHENLKVSANGNEVLVVDFEKYMDLLERGLERSCRCDYLLADNGNRHEKIAFCDLTCSQEKYVDSYVTSTGKTGMGKRAKAISQLSSSIEVLLNEPVLEQYILTCQHKIGLLGWRDYTAEGLEANQQAPAVSMRTFMRTPSSEARSLTTKVNVLGHGFDFIQVKYPLIYIW